MPAGSWRESSGCPAEARPLLVVTRFDRRVTNALEPWGFAIRATTSKATEPTPDPKPVEPGV